MALGGGAGRRLQSGLRPRADKQRDAAVAADRDGDGVANAEDNCPDRANTGQSDADGDLRGDVCDECPLLRRTSADGDGDGVGDACDPQPTLARECLSVLETFSDATAFDAHWTVEKDTASTITIDKGKVTLAPAAEISSVTITEKSTAGQYGTVMVLGRALGPLPIVLALAGKVDQFGFYACRLQGEEIAIDGFGPSTEILSGFVPDVSVGDRFLIRLDTIAGTTVQLLCRIDYGASVAAQARTSEVGSGPSGVRVTSVPAEIDAIAFVASRDAGQPCTTEYR